jgi:predicted DNA repair protein MutK
MSGGLLALFDDIAALAKVAAASVDDVAAHAAKAGAKAAGVVIDDTAVTPRYVTGFSPARELPIIGRIALGSLKNKLVILLPVALALSLLLPQAITPLLMIGGAYLCYEGAEKVYEFLVPHPAHAPGARLEAAAIDAKAFEDEKVSGAIKTDFILSAEIMAITLGAIPGDNAVEQAIILAVVGIGITAGVYGVVALIVKADDLGLALARVAPESSAAAPLRIAGRAIVHAMPSLLGGLGIIGTAAMIWVGGGIILHGLEAYGLGWPAHALQDAGTAVARAVPFAKPMFAWVVEAAGAGVVGFAVGLLAIPLVGRLLSPLWRQARSLGHKLLPRKPAN